MPFINSSIAYAQNLPGSVDPGRLQERLKTWQSAPLKEQPYLPAIREELHAAPSALHGFILKGMTIEGAKALSQQELASVYKEYLGRTADINTLQFIADRITQVYRQRGYFLSKAIVPAQEIEGGQSRIVVVEGYVSHVRIEGDILEILEKKDTLGILNNIIDEITTMRPLNGSDLERLLLLMSDFSGLTVHTVMEALPEAEAAPGAVGMVIKIDRQPHEISVTIDNFGSRYAGAAQISSNASFSNNVVAFDRASVALLTTANINEAKAVSGGYFLPLTAGGTSVNLQAGYSTLNPGFTLRQSDVQSTAYRTGIGLSKSLVRSRKGNITISVGIDLLNASTDVAVSNLYKDRIRALRLSSRFDRADNLEGINSGAMTFSQGLDILGARKTGTPNPSRAGGRSDFTKMDASLSRLQKLGKTWQIYGAARGQYAWNSLLSSEEFGYGGQEFGRAYDPSEITGDSGIAASLELRYTSIPEVYQSIFQPFAFYDIGKVWKPNAGMSGASAGIGVKFSQNQMITGFLSLAVPLTRPASAPPGYATGNSPRGLFQLSFRF